MLIGQSDIFTLILRINDMTLMRRISVKFRLWFK